MVWNRILGRKDSRSSRVIRKRRKRRPSVEKMERRELLAVDLGAISGVAFVDELGSGSAVGNPPVLVDSSGDLVAPGTVGATGIEITLYDDTNLDGLLDAGDVVAGTTTTTLEGNYRFDNLAAGQYLLQQQSVPQLQPQSPTVVSVVDALGSQESLIDDYSATAQSVAASPGDSGFDFAAAAEVIGGERDIVVTNSSTVGSVNAIVNETTDQLLIGSLGATGTAAIQYDGLDGSQTLDPSGLNGQSLAGGAAGDVIAPNTGLVVVARADLAGAALEITIYSDAANFSSATVNIPEDNTNLVETLVPFSSFVVGGGVGADFNDVGAIVASINLLENLDVFVSIVESRSPIPVQQDLANTIVQQTDLSIVKSDNSDPVNAGTQLTYTLSVENAGPDIAEQVVVTDQLPAGVTFASGDLEGDSSVVTDQGNGLIQINVGTLTAGQSRDITIVVDVAGDFSGTLTNNASVSSTPDQDIDLTNNSTNESTVVNRIVDVAVAKSSSGTAIAGDELTYTVQVSNSGPSQADNVIVTDTLDGFFSFVANSFDPGTSGANLTVNDQLLEFDIGTLLPGQTESFTFNVLVDSAASGSLSNTAVISTSDVDSNSANDSSTDNVVLERQVDLVLTKSVDSANVIPGQDQVVYTFTVSHAETTATSGSLSDALNVVVTDIIPSGLTGVSINAPTADSTGFANGVVTVGYDQIPLGESRTFSLVSNVNETASGTITNTGSVASSVTDFNPNDNVDGATITADPEFDLAVVKTVNVSDPSPTDSVVYTVTVENSGPSAALDVVLTDSIPSGLTFVSAAFDGLAGTSDGTTVSFPANTISGGVTAVATIEFTVDADADGLITNVAQVPDLTAFGELSASNNSDTAEINVVAITDLRVEKSVSAGRTIAGSDLVYEITVTNDGPSPAAAVQVVDTLPAGVTFTSGTGPNGEVLSAANGTVTYDAGSLAGGSSIELTINVTLNAAVETTQTNVVMVSSETLDTDPNNNSASATTSIDPASSTFAGLVFLDINNNGEQDFGEPGLPNVLLTLSGTNFLGIAVSDSILTNSEGRYLFTDLAEGVYQVDQSQPNDLRDGLTMLGTGTTAQAADNVFLQIGLGAASNAVDFNFSELPQRLSKRSFLASS